MAKYIINTRTFDNRAKNIDGKFEKIEHVRLKRFAKSDDGIPNGKKPLTTLRIQLNTQPAFKRLPTKSSEIIIKDFEGEPNRYTIYEYIVERLRNIVKQRVSKIVEVKQSVKIALVMTFTIFKTEANDKGDIVYREEKLHARTYSKQIVRANITDYTNELLDD